MQSDDAEMSPEDREELIRFAVALRPLDRADAEQQELKRILAQMPDAGRRVVDALRREADALRRIAEALLAVLRLFEHRLGRPLTEGERDVVVYRFDRSGPVRMADVVFDRDAPALTGWLADPHAA